MRYIDRNAAFIKTCATGFIDFSSNCFNILIFCIADNIWPCTGGEYSLSFLVWLDVWSDEVIDHYFRHMPCWSDGFDIVVQKVMENINSVVW